MQIEASNFGRINIDGQKYGHDVVIFPHKIKKRKKWITKRKHGTSHRFTREEMEEYLQMTEAEEIQIVVVGTGYYGRPALLEETKELLAEKGIQAVELETPQAADRFTTGKCPRDQKLGIFHVTC